MSKKQVQIVEDVEVLNPEKGEADYWMTCKKPTTITLSCILIVSQSFSGQNETNFFLSYPKFLAQLNKSKR
jgi:hypothetical protein